MPNKKKKNAVVKLKETITPTGGGGRKIAAITERTYDYARTLANPRAFAGARIPVPPMVPSATVSAMFRVNFPTSSVNGYGFILVNPFRMVANDVTSAAAPVWVSASAYAGAFAFDTTTAPTPSTFLSNSPYVKADFAQTTTGGLKYRLVSAAIVCTYTGTTLNQGGVFMTICDPAGGSLIGSTATRCASVPNVFDRRIGNSPFSVNWCPCDPDDFEYKQNPESDGFYCMGILLSTPGVSQPFTAEVFANFEVVGAKAMGATMIRPDTDGALAVAGSAASQHVGGQTGSGMSVKSILSGAAQAIVDSSSAVMTAVAEKVGGSKALTNAAANYVIQSAAGRFSSGAPRIEL